MNDTIAAVSTAAYPSAIGIIRISGPLVTQICSQILFRKDKPISKEWMQTHPRFSTYCELVFSQEKLDQVLFTFYPSPNSFTGEDMGEISLHGNPILLKKTLDILFTLGARPAQKGEFTKRAYFNGKLDISSALAISQVISARSKFELELAQKNMFGEIHRLESRLRSELINIKAECEAEIDFSTEDLTFESLEQRKLRIKSISQLCKKVISGNERAQSIIQKSKIVIYGEPNTGKSSLMNLILGRERAIVSHIPGTTRDFLAEDLYLEGLPIQLVDTAGVRETKDPIEKQGIERSEKEFSTANVRILVIDLSLAYDLRNFENKYLDKLAGTIVVGNKLDLVHPSWDLISFEEYLKQKNSSFVEFSCKSKIGLENLLQKIHAHISSEENFQDLVLLEDRNLYLLKKILHCLQEADKLIEENAPVEVYVKEIDQALDYVGQINGRIDTEEVLGRIFSKFCVGK
jgi:tRNA modification GTPase